MIDNSVLKMLSSRNPETRKEGVKLLAQTKSADALPHLANVFRGDKDPDVREMARKAGFYIKKQAGKSGSSGNSSWEIISQNSTVQADIEDAIEYVKQGNSERAATKLAQALEHDPDLEDHPKVIRIAEHLTGLKGKPAVRDVIDFAFGSSYASGNLYEDDGSSSSSLFDDDDDGSASSFISSYAPTAVDNVKISKKTGQKPLSDWGQVAVDLAMYTLVSIGGSIALIILINIRIINPILNASASGSTLSELRDYMQQGMTAYISSTVTSTIVNTIIFMFFGLLIHLASDMFLYGDGSYTELMHKITPYTTIISVINFAIIGILIFAMPDPAGFMDGNVISDQAYVEQASKTIESLLWLFVLFNFGGFVYYGKVIGDAYRFGMYKGCLSMFMVFCFFMAFGCCLSFALSSSLNSV